VGGHLGVDVGELGIPVLWVEPSWVLALACREKPRPASRCDTVSWLTV
jgi:hypothetical protein